MSTAAAATTLDYDSQPAETLRQEMPSDDGGGAIGWIKSHVWALSDQVLISGTNFATGVFTANALAENKSEFGIFSSIYALLLFSNIFQSTLITQAHNVIGATRLGRAYQRYTSSTAAAQIAIILVQVILAVVAAIVAHSRGWDAAPMLVALVPSIIFWQLQEFLRRALYTEHRYTAAFINDVVSYGGQALLIGLAYAAHANWGWSFTGALALYLLAVTSAAAVGLGLWQLRHSFAPEVNARDIEENWHFGKWLLGGELMGWASSLHMQVWWAALLLGTAVSADLRAVQILFGPTRVIAFFLGTILPIRFSRTLHTRGVDALRSQVTYVYKLLAPMAGVYCLLLALFPKFLLHLIYRRQYASDEAASVLVLFAGAQFISYMQMVVASALTASRQTRFIFAASAWGCGIALIASPLCIHLFGANGAIVSIIATYLVVTALLAHAYQNYLHVGETSLSSSSPGNGQRQMGATAVDMDVPVLSPPAGAREVDAAPAEAQLAARGALLARVLDTFDREGLAYCILHGHEKLPGRVISDVDMLIPREMLPRRLHDVLRTHQRELGAQVVQWFADGGVHFVVLADGGSDTRPPVLLQLHVSTDFALNDRVVFSGEEMLRSRRKSDSGLWIPSAGKEFACVLANRLNKRKLDEPRTHRLGELWAEDEEKCRKHLGRLLPESEAEVIAKAAATGDWTAVRAMLPTLRVIMRNRLFRRDPVAMAGRSIARQFRRLDRWIWPRCGLHVVFLGPDGVGKSTVIDEVRERIAPAFLETQYQTFARGILPARPKEGPHALPPRSLPESMIKAAWWLLCYGPGYLNSVHPTVARGGVAINHRYLVDAIVDPHRYRYSGPIKLVRWIWRFVPKPDLIIFLDAPVEVICARKQEMPAEELTELRGGYLNLARTLPNACVVRTNQELNATVHEVTGAVFDLMSRRIARRTDLK
jgi:O-antigen/teichoic acid export membrane protein/thymidylate kinase